MLPPVQAVATPVFFVCLVLLSSGTAVCKESTGGSKSQEVQDSQQFARWAANEALVEWQVARVATSCNAVATSATSPAARREALRFKAAYATSSYSVLAGRNSLVQTLDLVAMSHLTHLVWITERRAVSVFGNDATSFATAITDIHKRTRSHALKQISERELELVEDMVESWRSAHPGPMVVEFIRFEAFANEIAASLGHSSDLGGMFGRIAGEARDAVLLGERALSLLGRMPRLAEWHAEAAAANVLTQPALAETLDSVRQLGQLHELLPQQIQVLDARLAALPKELTQSAAPEIQKALGQVQGAVSQLEHMQGTLEGVDKSLALIGAQLNQLNDTTRPDELRQFADQAADRATKEGRSLILLATLCGAGLLLLQSLLRRKSAR